MKNTWLERSVGKTPVAFALAGSGLVVRIEPRDVKGWYPIGMGAGTRIILKSGKEYLVRDAASTVARKLKRDK